MKKSLKGLLGLITLFVILLALVRAQAQGLPGGPLIGNQLYQPITGLQVNGAVTTSAVTTVQVQGAKYVGFQLTSSNKTANVSNTVVTIDRSIDGVNWVNGTISVQLANTGTVQANCISNFNPQTDGVWRLNVQNGALAGVTNWVGVTVNRVP